MIDKTVIDRLVELGGAESALHNVPASGADPFVVIPSGCRVESLVGYCPPNRIRRAVSLDEPSSFCEYVNRFKSKNTLIFCALEASTHNFTAILDYHGPDVPAYCAHTACFLPRETREWTAWQAKDGRAMSQREFAEFIEEHRQEILEPPGAELLELVETLHGHCDARFSNAVRLASGALKFSYDEDISLRGTITTKQGEFELPRQLTASLSPFYGTPAVAVTARLKFTVKKPTLELRYELVRPHVIVRDALCVIVKSIAEQTKIVPLIGTAS